MIKNLKEDKECYSQMLKDILFKKEYCKGKINKKINFIRHFKGKQQEAMKSVFDVCVIDSAPMDNLKYHHNKINF